MNGWNMKVHYFQHVPFEGLGSIELWLNAKSFQISATRFYEDPSLPDVNEIDWLIIMGGSMSVNDEQEYTWLRAEKEFIVQAIKKGKIVLGICLGAQLIASALETKIYPNKFREIGWYPIQKVLPIGISDIADIFPSTVEVFQWHGETFDLPKNALLIAKSEACKNQAFSLSDNVLGLQFHLEATMESVKALIENCREEIVPDKFIQTEMEIISNTQRFNRINTTMEAILNYFLKK
jgi:GMP synthase-like glutamine amidotransferase